VGGALVRVHSLQANPQYNDKCGMLRAYSSDKDRWSVSIFGYPDFIWCKADNLAVVSSGAGVGGAATQRRPGLHTEGGYTMELGGAEGGGEIGAVFNGNVLYNEEDRSHPHSLHLAPHCLQYLRGSGYHGSRAYAVQWGQGEVYADSDDDGDGLLSEEEEDFPLSKEGGESRRGQRRAGPSRRQIDTCLLLNVQKSV
jgi:hypothetical protein